MPHIEVLIRKLKDRHGRRIVGYSATLDTVPGPSEMYADGSTPDEATQRLREKVSHALNDCHYLQPEVFTFKGFTAIIYVSTIEPSPKGETQYGSRIVNPRGEIGCVTLHCGNYAETRRHVEFHLASLLYPDTEVSSLFTSEGAESDYRSWLAFQKRYTAARLEGGCTDTDAHSYAGFDPRKTAEWFEQIDARIRSTRETLQALKDVQS